MTTLEIREDERTRIARELHDELGQRLVLLKFEVASIAKLAAVREHIPQGKLTLLCELVDNAVDSVRTLVSGLEPPILRECGLIPKDEGSPFKTQPNAE